MSKHNTYSWRNKKNISTFWLKKKSALSEAVNTLHAG